MESDKLEKAKEEFIEAYEELADSLFRHCFFKVSDREKAKDLVQDVFVKSWQHVVKGKEISNLKAFLYTVANNLIIDYYRKTKEISLDYLREKGFDYSISGEHDIVINAEHSKAIEVLQSLPKKYKEIIIWRLIDGLTPKEIAEVLGTSENVVSVRLNRALKKLREKLK